MSKVLIIGCKGFIGSHLENYLISQPDNEVWGCDVINDYTSNNYYVIDASNSDFEELFQLYRFDVCINCSGSASVPDSLIHPLRDFYLNTLNVFKLMEAIRKHANQCKFLNISSAAVYGNPTILPIREQVLLKPLSPYGYHKLQSENICEEFNKFYDLQTCCVRIFSAYGNGLKKQLFWDVAQKSKTSCSINLYGTGKESRDFIHIDDIAKVIELIILKGDFEGACYNVANGVEISVNVAVKKLLSYMEWEGEVSFNGHQRQGDPLNWQADISKITALGYQSDINLDFGLNNYVAWLKEEKLV